MLTKRIIPCLDVRDGRVVKGIKFSEIRDAGSPSELAALYEAHGADELVILDISATSEERKTQVETIKEVRSCLSIPLTVGGGVRCVDDARRLLEAGADKVAVNTAAVNCPSIISEIADQFGRQCTILAIDAAKKNNSWEVVVRSGTSRPDIDAVQWAKQAVELGAGEILLTSWDRDGTREGYDIELLSSVCSAVNVPVIASGGANTPEHLMEAFRAGADAVLAASIFHYGDYTVSQIKNVLANAGWEIRQ